MRCLPGRPTAAACSWARQSTCGSTGSISQLASGPRRCNSSSLANPASRAAAASAAFRSHRTAVATRTTTSRCRRGCSKSTAPPRSPISCAQGRAVLPLRLPGAVLRASRNGALNGAVGRHSVGRASKSLHVNPVRTRALWLTPDRAATSPLTSNSFFCRLHRLICRSRFSASCFELCLSA